MALILNGIYVGKDNQDYRPKNFFMPGSDETDYPYDTNCGGYVSLRQYVPSLIEMWTWHPRYTIEFNTCNSRLSEWQHSTLESWVWIPDHCMDESYNQVKLKAKAGCGTGKTEEQPVSSIETWTWKPAGCSEVVDGKLILKKY